MYKLQPLSFKKFTNSLNDINKLNDTIECIKHMNIDIIETIFNELNEKVEYIKLCKFFNVENREIVYVKSIKFEKDSYETLVSRCFYKSTGTSRGDVNIRNYWFPCIGFRSELSKNIIVISKLEDNILQKLYIIKDNSKLKDINTMYIEDNLTINNHPVVKYCRFVTELNSYVSKALLKLSPEYISSIPTFPSSENSIKDVDILLDQYLQVTTECNHDIININL